MTAPGRPNQQEPSMTDMVPLLPCPFCGEPPRLNSMATGAGLPFTPAIAADAAWKLAKNGATANGGMNAPPHRPRSPRVWTRLRG